MRDHRTLVLSKSKYLRGLQCPKLLWCEYHAKDFFPPADAAVQALLAEGRQVGAFARALFPEGIQLEHGSLPEEHHAQSLAALKQRRPLFEAGFSHEGAYAIADILVPAETAAWDLYEVKSATQMKEEFFYDVAFQRYVFEKAGVKIRKCFIMHIDSGYLRRGALEPGKLFLTRNITEEVEDRFKETGHKIKSMRAIIGLPRALDVGIGPYCEEPHDCVLKSHCWKFLPEKDHVFILSRGKKLAFELVSQGVFDVLNIPPATKLTDKQCLQVACHRAGKPHIDTEAVREFLSRLRYPVHFLDFETAGPAVPAYDLSRPYEKIPFQFSLHVLYADGYAVPRSFLAEGAEDPRPLVLQRLRQFIGTTGSIVAYNAQFEMDTIKNAAAIYPEYREWSAALEGRFIDLLEPFRGFAYYHPRQEGSNSIKHVLPALTGLSYKGMEIANGALASTEYARVTFNREVSDAERHKVYAALKKYCDLDTRGMMEIVAALGKKVAEPPA